MNAIKSQTLRVLRETYSNATTVKEVEVGKVTIITFEKLDFDNNKRMTNSFKVGPRGGLSIILQEFSQYR